MLATIDFTDRIILCHNDILPSKSYYLKGGWEDNKIRDFYNASVTRKDNGIINFSGKIIDYFEVSKLDIEKGRDFLEQFNIEKSNIDLTHRVKTFRSGSYKRIKNQTLKRYTDKNIMLELSGFSMIKEKYRMTKKEELDRNAELQEFYDKIKDA